MGNWIGWRGTIPDSLRQLATRGASEVRIGADCGLAVFDDGAEPISIAQVSETNVRAALGDADAGSWLVVDLRHSVVVAGCDPFGLHGVSTTDTGGATWVASDSSRLVMIRRQAGSPVLLDPSGLHGYLCFSYVPTPSSPYAGVDQLAAGTEVRFASEGENRIVRAVWCETAANPCSEADAVQIAAGLIRDAVVRKLADHREVGVFLSGGLDSSLVAALLLEAGARVRLFTLDFGAPRNEEVAYAQMVADHLEQPLTRVRAGPVQVQSALTQVAAALQSPFGDAVTIPLYLLGKAAKDQVGVVFNGEGGDQLFGGWNNKPLIAAALYEQEAFDLLAGYRRTFHRLDGLTHQFYSERGRRATQRVDVGEWLRPALEAPGFASLLHRLRAANLWLKGAQNIAPRARQLAEAHGLQMRSPFFDRRLTEWTFTLPPSLLLNGACEKYLLKRVAESYLPPEIVWRDKRGMGVPVTDWIFGDLRREVGYRLGNRGLGRTGWFDEKAIRALTTGEGEPGEVRRRRVGEKVWLLLMLQAWIQESKFPLEWPDGSR